LTKVTPFAKAIVALVYGVLAVVLDASADNVITRDEWRQVLAVAIGALLVYLVPNKAPEA
jgi:glucose uptake protein GlcU